jgi:hypothetical protein
VSKDPKAQPPEGKERKGKDVAGSKLYTGSFAVALVEDMLAKESSELFPKEAVECAEWAERMHIPTFGMVTPYLTGCKSGPRAGRDAVYRRSQILCILLFRRPTTTV